ncbi:General transcription factor II-I repeat domain-containing protein 2A [Eumeta japonica]|uniref:General transcription factor II-I repeat domain-containing protein 2A n=1 Tax=Eumeta variegata TaxID=151549 RepID=A0A4C1XR70_EUMVA|nr:General transcription factor II-I repeat domain-containing protein 2A [Eumeta japonica]
MRFYGNLDALAQLALGGFSLLYNIQHNKIMPKNPLGPVVRHKEMMSNDTKTTLTDHMAGFALFFMALDESTDLSDTTRLAICIRGIDKEFTVIEELLASQRLKGITTREDFFNEVEKLFISFGLPWSKLVGVCTDGVPSMVGLRKSFIGILNEKAT